jgi:hypothetical protein
MSWQLWDPPAIIIPAPIQSEIKAEQKEQIPIDEHYKKVYDTAWNKLQPDGRINIDGESSASISPYSKHFRSQVEDRIWPLVELLYLKGYLPVSSCGGHRGTLLREFERGFFEYSACPYVMIVVNRDCEQDVLQSLGKPLYTDISVTHSMGGMDASKAGEGKIVKSKRKDIKNEYESLNWMMQRNYDKWSYITIRINPWKRMSLKYILRTKKEKKLISYVVEKYRDLPEYIF